MDGSEVCSRITIKPDIDIAEIGATLAEAEAKIEAEKERLGLDAADDRAGAALGAYQEAVGAVYETVPRSREGLLALIGVFQEDHEGMMPEEDTVTTVLASIAASVKGGAAASEPLSCGRVPSSDRGLMEAQSKYEALVALDHGETDEEFDRIAERQTQIEALMIDCAAQSLFGLRAKARMLKCMLRPNIEGEKSDPEDRVAWSLSEDIERAYEVELTEEARRAAALIGDYLPPSKAPWPKGELSYTRTRRKPKPGQIPRDFWVVEETGNWEADNKIGEELAREGLKKMRQTQDPHGISHAVSGMIEHGRHGGIEVGFLFAIGWWLMKGTGPR